MTNEERNALIAQGWTPPPEPVDPDLSDPDWVNAQKICDGIVPDEFYGLASELVYDGIKRGRALAAEAKPGMVWKEHDGSEKRPVDTTDGVMVQYAGGTRAYKIMAYLIHDWESVTHYCEIPQPEDAA